MKNENKNFYDSKSFTKKVEQCMNQKEIDFDELCDRMNENVGYNISKSNLKIYIYQRIPSVNFIIALSKALGISIDYLLTDNSEDEMCDGFDFNYTSERYYKYISNDYHLFFYETKDNVPGKLIEAKMSITYTNRYIVTMSINIEEGKVKEYVGELLLSKKSPNGFITLKGDIGEVVSLAFYDPFLNKKAVRLIVGLMLSISSGDQKRSPVVSRFVLSTYKIDERKIDCVKANLTMNTKYINITENSMKDTIRKILPKFNKEDGTNEIFSRLINAFNSREYYAIEENFINNTLKQDYRLTQNEINDLVVQLRLNSISNANSKINRMLDSKIFEMTDPSQNSINTKS